MTRRHLVHGWTYLGRPLQEVGLAPITRSQVSGRGAYCCMCRLQESPASRRFSMRRRRPMAACEMPSSLVSAFSCRRRRPGAFTFPLGTGMSGLSSACGSSFGLTYPSYIPLPAGTAARRARPAQASLRTQSPRGSH